MRFKKLMISLSLFVSLHISSISLEVKLHKEVKITDLFEWKYALKGGDIILLSKDKKRIVVYDSKGNIRFQWGPKLDRGSLYIDISHDGKTFIFTSSKPVYQDIKLHYCKDGKEIWVKDLAGHGHGIGKPFLSPDGSYILAVSDMETGEEGIKCFNDKGKLIWHKHKNIEWIWGPENSEFEFSSDSKYFYTTCAADGIFYLFDSDGNILFKKKYAWGKVKGNYVEIGEAILPYWIPKPPENELPIEGIYDLKGNLVTDFLGLLSDDGTKILTHPPGKIKLYEFPTLRPLREYTIDFEEEYQSQDFRFLFELKNGILSVLDTETGIISKAPINGDIWFVSYDGRYFLTVDFKKDKIWFYELVY